MRGFNPDEIHERLRIAGEEWADKDAAASALEETKKTLLAQLSLKSQAGTVKQCELEALADPVYKLHVENMVAARQEANRARVRYETGKIWSELKRTAESTKRAEMLQQ